MQNIFRKNENGIALIKLAFRTTTYIGINAYPTLSIINGGYLSPIAEYITYA